MTAADCGSKSLTIIGPQGTTDFWTSTRKFTYRPKYPISLVEVSALCTREVASVDIHCIPFGVEHSHICYIVESKAPPGKFNIKSAKELGVPSGPLYKILQGGQTVTLADGRTIYPHQVMGAPEKTRFAAIIPSLSSLGDIHWDSLFSQPVWQR